MSDIEARLADPKFIAAINDTVQTIMAQRVREGRVPADGPKFEEERSWLAVETLTLFLKA